MLLYSGFQVVTLDDPGDATEILVGIYMSSGPCLLVHGEESFHIAVAAVRQRCHKHVGRDNFTGICQQRQRSRRPSPPARPHPACDSGASWHWSC